MKRLIVLLGVMGCQSEIALPNASIRFYFAYGDADLVAIARRDGSDPLAEVGREVPTSVAMRVPAQGSFKLQLWRETLLGPQTPFSTNLTAHLMFDRAFATDESLFSVSQRDTHSFYKVEPLYTSANLIAGNFSNLPTELAFNVDGSALDFNGDGLQDHGQLTTISTSCTGSYIQGTAFQRILRGIGLSARIRNRVILPNGTTTNAWSYHPIGRKDRLADVSWRNNLAIDEAFGLGVNETGLAIHTTGSDQTGSETDTGVGRNRDLFPGQVWTNLGAKYNLIGAAPVPEPASALALGLATLALLRGRRR